MGKNVPVILVCFKEKHFYARFDVYFPFDPDLNVLRDSIFEVLRNNRSLYEPPSGARFIYPIVDGKILKLNSRMSGNNAFLAEDEMDSKRRQSLDYG